MSSLQRNLLLNNRLNTVGDPTHTYIDLDIVNNSTNYQPQPVIFQQTNLSNIVDKIDDYYMSVVKWSFNANIPVIIPKMELNTTGLRNTASGYYSLRCNTTGCYNTATGGGVLECNTTGCYNTGSGIIALNYNTTGTRNTAFGSFALSENTTGSCNTAVGYHALYLNTTGSCNTAIGNDALVLNLSGCCNTAIGTCSLYFNTTGSDNVAVGQQTLYCNVTGSSNVGIGPYAGYYETESDRFIADNQTRSSTTYKTSALLYGTFNATAALQTLAINAATTVNGSLKSTVYTETAASPAIASNTLNLTLSTANLFTVNLNADITTFNLNSLPVNTVVYSLILQFIADGTPRAVTWPGSVKWAGGTAPTLTSTLNKVDTFVLMTPNSGTDYYGFVSSQNA
jgi:hypothetical protein